MKKVLGAIVLLAAAAGPALSGATEQTNCAEPIPKLFQRVAPTVVSISAVAINAASGTDRMSTLVGAGVILSSDGLVLTNSHVVYGRRGVTIRTVDGRGSAARLLGADPILDLAVLHIAEPPEGLLRAALGDSDNVRVGEEVIAIGNPSGLGLTLTRGVVSSVNQILFEIPVSLPIPLIQTDAAINPGNSGGPLLNRCGEVIGIITSALADAQGIGFAVPINVAKQVTRQLAEEGRVIRPWLGVGGKVIGRELRSILSIPLVDGFLVETIEPGSPAERAGLQDGNLPIMIGEAQFLVGGDIITSINGQPLDSHGTLAKLVGSLKIGDTALLTLYRNGKTREVAWRLPERPILPGDVPSDAGRSVNSIRGPRIWSPARP